MKVALTGANGFVGRAVTARLRAAGHDVLPIVRRAAGLPGELVVGDLGEADIDPARLAGADAVIHLAARTHVLRESAADPLAAYRHINVEGTRRLLDAALAAGVRRFVFMSSVKASGEWTRAGEPFTPDIEPRPEDAYGVSKLEAEQLVRQRCAAAGVEWVIIRPPLVYGAGVGANFERLLKLAGKGLPLPLGAVRNRRSIISVANLAEATVRALASPGAADRLLLLCDTTLSTANLLKEMGRALGRKVRLVPVPTALLRLAGKLTGRQGEVARLCDNLEIDASSSIAALGWVPSQTLAEALDEIVDAQRAPRGTASER